MSTQTELEIVSPGAFASLQDGGRHGFRRIGVPWAGVLDRRLMRIANALAGRDEDAPVIECFDGGLHLTAHGGAAKVAVAGDAVVEVDERVLVRNARTAVAEAFVVKDVGPLHGGGQALPELFRRRHVQRDPAATGAFEHVAL